MGHTTYTDVQRDTVKNMYQYIYIYINRIMWVYKQKCTSWFIAIVSSEPSALFQTWIGPQYSTFGFALLWCPTHHSRWRSKGSAGLVTRHAETFPFGSWTSKCNAVIFEDSDFFRIYWQRKHAMVLCGISISQPDTIENIEGLGKLGVKGIPRNGPGRRKRLLLASGLVKS